MSARRFLKSLSLAVVAVACTDAAAPSPERFSLTVPSQAMSSARSSNAGMHPLKQSATAPELDTYQVSFWAVKGKSALLKVKYRDLDANRRGGPFLQFAIPSDGLVSGANGARLRSGDSVQITLTIDRTTFQTDFQPSGVQFNNRSPATLQMWFANADPDLNEDGVVDQTDTDLLQQLSIWYSDSDSPWAPQASQLDLSQSTVLTSVYHFSGYSVAW